MENERKKFITRLINMLVYEDDLPLKICIYSLYKILFMDDFLMMGIAYNIIKVPPYSLSAVRKKK